MTAPEQGFRHAALVYRTEGERVSAVADFLRSAREAAAPVHAVLPREALRRAQDQVSAPPALYSDDMTDLGRNPARLIPAAHSFADAHPGPAGVFCLWEPAWPSRSPAELREVARHEALCNLAFRGRAMNLLCLYDAAGLGDELIRDAEQTHPDLIANGQQHGSPAYLGPGRFPAGTDDPLPEPGPDAEKLAFRRNLRPVREFAARHARTAGLDRDRAADLVLAISELAANALEHSASGGVVWAWCTGAELICQVQDDGHITDPLAGRRRQPPDAFGGHGLWLVNQVCDLVESRFTPSGTTTRLHMSLQAKSTRT